MATLYVENVPDVLYEALRARARARRRSIAAEVVSLLESSIPTKQELQARREFLRKVERMQSGRPGHDRPSTDEMQREDRSR